ncbi:uncharacterized protein LOC117749883 [Cyclopterus lumpus]|uniref:uncharacterized protein LOC117749883 n=1 Tax=Cyclopterus lumpus TaxID=8103 RepID=UPI001485EF7A|nr:uncharacterized protein LOC117749883 [Cyclopterus lumpus]
MHVLCFEGWWTHNFLLVIWFLLLAPKAEGYFLGDTKAVLNGCEDHWTLQDGTAVSLLFQMTLCVDVRVVVPGAWVAFSYSSVHAPRPDLGLEGDDEALYAWLLRVRHRFPIRLTPKRWHRVCLRRDALGKSISLEVDGTTVAERTIIARAIPPAGTLWLGCRPRDRPPGASLGQVELYLFRVWADLGRHGPCEDGTVIGWSARHWGVTSPRARRRDPGLLCDGRRARAYRSVTDVSCNVRQLCSNTGAYFWMSVSVEAAGDKTERDVHDLLSNAFGCHSEGFFCLADRQLQAVQVNCSVKSPIRQTSCNVLLQLRGAVPACQLQLAGVSALQQAGDGQLRATISGRVERVARDVCGNVEPSSGGFVRCTSTSSLDEICRGNKPSELTCSRIEPNSHPAPGPQTESCSSDAPRICDCDAFCSSASQFFAMRIKITSASVNENLIKALLSGLSGARKCNTMSASVCQDILKRHKHVHLECHGTPQRLYDCMVILEMSGPVNGCSLNILLQQVIDSHSSITIERPLTRMVVCGPPGLAVSTLLASNLTWVVSDLLTSDVCQPEPTLLKCEANENFAVLLTDSCPTETPTTTQNPTQPFNLTNGNRTTTPEAFTPSVTNTTEQTENASQATNQPNVTNPLATTNTTESSTAKSVIERSTQTDSMGSTTTMPPNHTTEYNITTVTPSVIDTTKYNLTTATPSTNPTTDFITTATPSTNPTTEFNITTATPSTNPTSLTTDFKLTTTVPEVIWSTTAADSSDESTTSNTPTTHGTLPTQINTTTSKVPLTSSTTPVQTIPLTKTTTTKPGTETTSTTKETTQEAQEEQANQLLNQTNDASQLNSSQVSQLVGNLEKLLDGPTVSQALGQKAVNVISNLMEGDSLALSVSSSRLVRLVDDLGLKLVVDGDKEIVSSDSLVLAVREVDGTNFPVTSVDIFNIDNVQIRSLSRSRSKRSGSGLGSVFLPSSLTDELSLEQQNEANRVQFTFYTKSAFFQDAALDEKTLVSPVLAASVANLSISNLKENIQFTIRNIDPVHENYTASCAFWQSTPDGGGGHWSSAGCFVVNATAEATTCSCNHLTSFAILLDLSRDVTIDRQHAQILTFITYIGCGISAIFLALTLLTYLFFDKLLRDIPAKILVQLCLSLLLLNLVFLLDGWLALYPAIGLCISTAFFLHYFLLTSFTWAGLEALHMYLSIVRVFSPYLSRYMLKFSLMGWGIPLLVVTVVIAVDKDNYGLVTYGQYTDGATDDFCWLRNDIAFYVGVVAYFLLIFGLCLLVFIVVMIQLSRIKKQNPQNQSPNRGVMADLRSVAGLVILLGLTWGFALFAWGPLYLPFVYLFTIFNSLQGFFVFIFHCALRENVRRQWRTYLCCGNLRLAENSDWSRTATQNKRGTSVATATTSVPYLTSRCSSVISDVTGSFVAERLNT